jgi:hypothetical protein
MNYAYATLLYPNKNGDCIYLDGAILTALGLRKQNVKYPIICMITKDISNDIVNILKTLYDDIIVVDYISPIKKLNQITIISDIFSKEDYVDDNNYKEIIKVFTKLHIFNSDIFKYDKILFVDNDLIPINKYDELFNLNCPCGWLERILEDTEKYPGYMNKYTRVCDIWKKIKHGDKIHTQLYKVPGRSINSGLLLIKPNKNIFDNMIKILQTPKNEWKNFNFEFKGTIDFNRRNVDYYILHDQDFLTQYFENEWNMIDARYCYWGDNIKHDIYGIHMAGLYYIINGNKKNSKTWQIQIPINDGFNIISNKVALWGFDKYPQLKNILYKYLQFYVFNKLYSINDINIDDDVYNELNRYQKKIIDILKSNNT